MENLTSFIESGILEMYVSGNASSTETDLVEQMASEFDEIRSELDAISETFEFYARSHAVAPNPVIKPFVMATVDYTERLKKGETPSFPPILEEGAAIDDYAAWLQRSDMNIPPDFKDIHAKIIGYQPTALTAIVWIREMAPQEVHDHEYEKFLIVEGTCDIRVEEDVYSLFPGDYFAIPLHKNHQVTVTSLTPCKVILQRVAA